MTTITIFHTTAELMQLTGISDYRELWNADFNLDDWDFGFVTDHEWDSDWGSDHPYYEYWFLTRMDNYCAGYEHTEYNGRHYYMLYHS